MKTFTFTRNAPFGIPLGDLNSIVVDGDEAIMEKRKYVDMLKEMGGSRLGRNDAKSPPKEPKPKNAKRAESLLNCLLVFNFHKLHFLEFIL